MSFYFYFKGIISSLEVKIGNNTSSLRSYMDELSTTKMLWKDVSRAIGQAHCDSFYVRK